MITAVIDCGTNTFNYLIAECNPGAAEHRLLHAGKFVVKLGEHGFPDGNIHPDAMRRALSALDAFAEQCRHLGAERIHGCATSAFRTSNNAREILAHCSNHLGFQLQIVSGEREAELIYLGVKASGALSDQTVLILDIGGGSNEFIIANASRIFWKGSFPIGIARLLERFTPSDPIAPEQMLEVQHYLSEELKELPALCKQYGIDTLVGASGSFDTLAEMISAGKGTSLKTEGLRSYAFSMQEYRKTEDVLLCSTLAQRLQMSGMLPLRAEMMVLAVLTIQWVLSRCSLSHMIMSGYSLKEGLLYETMS
jgi:exopolyphosphatase/guanosine-5'-triphosphate,3'-diphosphate pyrophosphatase